MEIERRRGRRLSRRGHGHPIGPVDNLPLDQTIPSAHAPEVHNLSKVPRDTTKPVSGGKYYRRATNRKNWEPHFNLAKEDIIDSSEHTITLDSGHILRKTDLAFKGKLLPGPKKMVVNQSSIGQNTTLHSSLARKKKLSPLKKFMVTDHSELRQGSSGSDGPTQASGSSKEAATTHYLTHNSSRSSSSSNLNS